MANESGRWYRDDGGKATLVEATLSEAKKNGYYPSVTSLLNTLAESYGLRTWREKQMVVAGATAPRLDGETDDQFSDRVRAEAYHEGDDAAERGKAVHLAIHKYLSNEDNSPADLPADLRGWMDINLYRGTCETELSVLSRRFGFAGTADYSGRYGKSGIAVVDFKTQRVRARGNRKSPEWYDRWLLQLVAYGSAIEDRARMIGAADRGLGVPDSFVSVVINTNPDHPDYEGDDSPGYWVRKWSPDMVVYGRRVIEALCDTFYAVNDRPKAPFQRPGGLGG